MTAEKMNQSDPHAGRVGYVIVHFAAREAVQIFHLEAK
jgi:hypothetical protein